MCRILPTLNTIRKNLTDDLLKTSFRNKERLTNTAGHCYVATETLYHLLSDKQKKYYKPHFLKIDGVPHWYLMHVHVHDTMLSSSTKIYEILDPTYDQFKTLPDHASGKRIGFLTKLPSKRTLILLKRIKDGSRLHTKNN